jgi:hypothetical protein
MRIVNDVEGKPTKLEEDESEKAGRVHETCLWEVKEKKA